VCEIEEFLKAENLKANSLKADRNVPQSPFEILLFRRIFDADGVKKTIVSL
jgi:hypothetical protein